MYGGVRGARSASILRKMWLALLRSGGRYTFLEFLHVGRQGTYFFTSWRMACMLVLPGVEKKSPGTWMLSP